MLQMHGVNRSFGDVRALQDVNVSMDTGEFVSIMGPSGSGKSTLLNVAALLDKPDSGLVRLGGVDVGDLSDRGLSRLRASTIGIVFQAFHLLAPRTAIENVVLGGAYHLSMGMRERHRRAGKLLALVGLQDRTNQRVSTLSGGEQQRVAIARALISEPELLVADEPTGNLDSSMTEDLMRLFTQINSAGVTILLVTHDADVARTATRQLEMRDGRIRGVGP